MRFQKGGVLIESLVAVLVFSIGIVGLLGAQALATKSGFDSKNRTDAAYLANQIISEMLIDSSNIDLYAHRPGTSSNCNWSGQVSNYAKVEHWIASLSETLPSTQETPPQILIETPSPQQKRVQVTICWINPSDKITHSFVAIAQIGI